MTSSWTDNSYVHAIVARPGSGSIDWLRPSAEPRPDPGGIRVTHTELSHMIHATSTYTSSSEHQVSPTRLDKSVYANTDTS